MDFKDGFKREMVRKLLLPGGKGVGELSREIGVTPQTLYNWRDKYSHSSDGMARKKRSGGLSAEEKMATLLEFARLPLAEWNSPASGDTSCSQLRSKVSRANVADA